MPNEREAYAWCRECRKVTDHDRGGVCLDNGHKNGDAWYISALPSCRTPECDCASREGSDVSVVGWPPFHEGCFCVAMPKVDIFKQVHMEKPSEKDGGK